jgi:two-component system cell cycle sensor histidine kinase/response regulator CckA
VRVIGTNIDDRPARRYQIGDGLQAGREPERHGGERTGVHLLTGPPGPGRVLYPEEVAASDEHPDRFRELVESLPQTIYEMDTQGRLTYVNRVAREVFGFTDADLERGVYVGQLLVPQDRDRARANIGRVMQGQVIGPQEYVARSMDGRVIPVTIESTVIVRDGQTTGLRGLVIDISQRKEDEAERERLRRRLSLSDRLASIGTMAAGVAHEINNPLSYMIGNLAYVTELLRRLRESSPDLDLQELQDSLQDAREGADRVRRIARDIRNLARGDDETRPVDMSRVVTAAVAIAENETRHRATLVLELADVPTVGGDEHRLTQVLVNLLVNAAQALPDGRADLNQIGIRLVASADDLVTLAVWDTGPGFPHELLPRVFDPFVSTKHGGQGGMGLGLAICQSILHESDAEIVARNRPEGGAEVEVQFRVFSGGAPRTVEAQAAVQPTGPGGRVLVVDDEPAILRLVERVLERHTVETAGSGREALEMLSRTTYDVVLCDLMMPEVSGVDVYQTLAHTNPGQERRIVFMTGGAFSERAREFLQHTGARTVSKPFDPDTLELLVRETVATA